MHDEQIRRQVRQGLDDASVKRSIVVVTEPDFEKVTKNVEFVGRLLDQVEETEEARAESVVVVIEV